MATTKKTPSPAPAKRKGGRPKNPDMPPVTGFRIPVALLARLDAETARREALIAHMGATVSRSSVLVSLLEEALMRAESAAGST